MEAIKLNNCPCGGKGDVFVEKDIPYVLCRDCKRFMTSGENCFQEWNQLKLPDYKDEIITHIYENGNKEFSLINNTSDIENHDLFIMFSVGFNACNGDIEKARKRLYLRKYEFQLYGKTRW